MNSIEFSISKSNKNHLDHLSKLKNFMGDKSIFLNNNNKILIDIPMDKLKLSLSKLPNIEGDLDVKGNICTTYDENNEVLVRFQIDSIIGKGSYGTVYKGILLGGSSAPKEYINKYIIIKVQSLYNNSNSNINLLKENLIHLILNSDKKIYKYIPKYITTFKSSNKLGSVMQWSGNKTFSDHLEDNLFTNNNIVSILQQLTKILEFMQQKYNFIHGDLKPNNIMVYKYKNKTRKINNEVVSTNGYTLKLIDFGFTSMKTKKYIIKNHPYDKNIYDKYYLDLLFLSLNIIRSLKKKNRTHLSIYKKLDYIVSSLFKEMQLKFEYHIKSNIIKQKNKRSLTDFFKIGMVEYIRTLDVLYDIVSMTLYVNNNDNNFFQNFFPIQFYKIITEAYD